MIQIQNSRLLVLSVSLYNSISLCKDAVLAQTVPDKHQRWYVTIIPSMPIVILPLMILATLM